MYIFFRPKSNHAKSSALNAGVLVGSQKGDVFDYITNLLENFENVDMTNPRDQILSPGSETNDDLFYPVIDYSPSRIEFNNSLCMWQTFIP